MASPTNKDQKLSDKDKLTNDIINKASSKAVKISTDEANDLNTASNFADSVSKIDSAFDKLEDKTINSNDELKETDKKVNDLSKSYSELPENSKLKPEDEKKLLDPEQSDVVFSKSLDDQSKKFGDAKDDKTKKFGTSNFKTMYGGKYKIARGLRGIRKDRTKVHFSNTRDKGNPYLNKFGNKVYNDTKIEYERLLKSEIQDDA
jgi:hypothetical protein